MIYAFFGCEYSGIIIWISNKFCVVYSRLSYSNSCCFDCPFFVYFKESNNNNKNPNDKSIDVNFFTIIQIMTSIIMFLFSLLFCYLTISISLLFHSWSYKQTNNHRHYGNYNNNNNNNHRPTTTTFIQKRYIFQTNNNNNNNKY